MGTRCGGTHELTVSTSLVVDNGRRPGTGDVALHLVEGHALALSASTRPCTTTG